MQETFGDYPWPDLVLAEVGSGGGFSMEYPRMIHLTRDKVADTYVVYHEVAHQWFYGQIGNDQQREPWLDEAFADFSARWLMGIGENQCSARPVDSEVFAWEAGATTGGDWTSCNGYFHAVFYRGTEFITAVRSAMGDDAFFSAMRSWVDRYRHGFVTGDRLLRHLQARPMRTSRRSSPPTSRRPTSWSCVAHRRACSRSRRRPAGLVRAVGYRGSAVARSMRTWAAIRVSSCAWRDRHSRSCRMRRRCTGRTVRQRSHHDGRPGPRSRARARR